MKLRVGSLISNKGGSVHVIDWYQFYGDEASSLNVRVCVARLTIPISNFFPAFAFLAPYEFRPREFFEGTPVESVLSGWAPRDKNLYWDVRLTQMVIHPTDQNPCSVHFRQFSLHAKYPGVVGCYVQAGCPDINTCSKVESPQRGDTGGGIFIKGSNVLVGVYQSLEVINQFTTFVPMSYATKLHPPIVQNMNFLMRDEFDQFPEFTDEGIFQLQGNMDVDEGTEKVYK